MHNPQKGSLPSLNVKQSVTYRLSQTHQEGAAAGRSLS